MGTLPLLGCGGGGAGGGNPLLDSLFAYYRLDDSLTDSSGNSRNLTPTSPTYGPAVIADGLLTGSGTISAHPGTSLQDTSMSIAGWFYGGPGVSATLYRGGGKLAWNNGGSSLFGLQYAAKTGTSDRMVVITVGSLIIGSPSGAGSYSITANVWSHVALTWNHSSQTWVIYINGSQVDTGTGDPGSTTLGDLVVAATGTINAGKDEAGFWGRTLSPTEVSTLYNGGSGFDPTA